MRYRLAVIAVSIVLGAGCSSFPLERSAGSTRTASVFEKNYRLREQRAAFVGQPIIAVKDFKTTIRSGASLVPSVPFEAQQALSATMFGGPERPLPVVGTVKIDGVAYLLAELDSQSRDVHIGVLVDSNGKPYFKLAGGVVELSRPMRMAGQAKFRPPDVRFRVGPDETVVDSKADFVNFELLYGGTDGRSFRVTYREYTPGDLIKPGFSQDLTYENTAGRIRFRDLDIEVFAVTSSEITYRVVADGLKGE